MQMMVRRTAIPLESLWAPATLAVLFVSENADLRCVAARVLTASGFRTTTAAHSGHAVLACMTNAYDVVVLDQELSDTPADAVVQTLRGYRPDLRVVRMCNRAPIAGGDAALVRPFTADALIEAVRSVVTLTSSAF